ncbi:MAG TPA: helix-turn-helix domain-containing protein [Pyrinomonadaceae bacterium]|nr:helix-turn-helix domain-containing protein [Pyrinomonadaceae bacterium]
MMNVAVLEHGEANALDAATGADATHESGEPLLENKVEALRELAENLLRQVNALGETVQARRTGAHLDLHTEVQRFECEIIRDALKRTGGHQRRAARLLGVKVSTLNAKIKRYQIQHDGPSAFAGMRLVGDNNNK